MSELANKIKQISLNAVEQVKPTDILFGIVETIGPISIRVDQRMLISERSLILTDAVRDYKTEISFDNPSVKQVYTTWDMEEEHESTQNKISFKVPVRHEITVYNALKVNEKVILIRAQGGQKFIVLGRLEVR